MNTLITSMQCTNWRADGEFVHCTQCRELVGNGMRGIGNH